MQQIRAVRVTGRIATTTSPGGRRITFRGRLVVSADLGDGEKAEYEEQAPRIVTETGAPELSVSPGKAGDLQSAQISLMRQLQAYRNAYQSAVQEARASLRERLQRHGVSVIEEED